MADELWETLLRFHREVFRPDYRRDLEAALGAAQGGLLHDMRSQFAEIHRRFDRLEQIGREHRQDPTGR